MRRCFIVVTLSYYFSLVELRSVGAFQSLFQNHLQRTKCHEPNNLSDHHEAPSSVRNLTSRSCPEDVVHDGWTRRGLFLSSSLPSSMDRSEQARKFLISSLLHSMTLSMDPPFMQHVDQTITQSDMNPNDIFSFYDQQITQLRSFIAQQPATWLLKILYIPTAMYALQRNSSRTPGQQRQQARADGKKRRDTIVQYINQLQLMGEQDVPIHILAITLDLDDGSLKQPYGSNEKSMFPQNGHEAFHQWNPNLIYFEGGNTFWLHHCIQKGKWETDIRRVCTSKEREPFAVFIGKSAGAIVGGRTVETACWKGWDDPSVVPDMPERDDWNLISGMKLAGGASFFPHMSPEWDHVVSLNTKLWQDSDRNHLFLLKDDDVVLVDGDIKYVSLVSHDC